MPKSLAQGSPSEQLHRNEPVAPIAIEIEVPHDIRMREGLRLLEFPPEHARCIAADPGIPVAAA